MAHIEKRRIKGHVYYYACRKGRVDGKPRNVWQKCLGTAENIIQTYEASKRREQGPISVEIAEFGGVAALLGIAERLKLVEIIDRHIPRHFRAMSTGAYMLLASINRCLAPRSKRQLASWYGQTSLPRLQGFKSGQLTSQRFWDHMDLLTVERIREIEVELTKHMVEEFDVNLSCLLYDATNFFTFIDTFTEGELAQRGKNKQGRENLRQVGLGLLVTRDWHIPLMHEIYPGNVADSNEFKSVTELLVHRYKSLSEQCEDITLVFDKGNNSEQNLKAIEESPFHFVASLVPTQHPDLLAVPLDVFRQAQDERLEGISTYRTRKTVFGVERTVVICYNENLLDTQLATICSVISKARDRLRMLQAKLKRDRSVRKGNRPTLETIQKQIKSILSRQHLADLIKTHIQQDRWGFTLSYRVDQTALGQLITTLFGKKILFTDQDDWTDEQLVLTYHGQACIEEAFKRMKDPHFLCWYPQFHRTDQKLQVHGFYCVLALLMASLLNRQLGLNDIHLSIPRMFALLKDIKEVALIYPQESSSNALPQAHDAIVLSKMTAEQRHIFDLLALSRFAPINATPYSPE